MENPLSIFPTRRAALSFASRTPGSSIIPAATGGYFVRYPVGVGRRNPATPYFLNSSANLFYSKDLRGESTYVNGRDEWPVVVERKSGKRSLIRLSLNDRPLWGWVDNDMITRRKVSRNPSQQSRSSVQSIIAAGYKSAHPAAKAGWFDVVTPDGNPAALWHQGAGLYHVFFAFRGTASGSSLERAYKGGLGDAISDDKEMRGYIRGVLSAPQALVNKYEGLREAQYQAENERRSSRRNPDDSGSAAELYEQFHGEPSDGETVYEETIETPDSFVELGDLIELKVATLHGKDVTISAPDPDRFDLHEIVKLASSPSGDQLYFIGGDQGIQLDKLGFKGDEVKPHMVIGVLYELTYRTRKGFDKFKLTDYYHAAGEDTGNQPMLNYDEVNNLMTVVGGEYRVKDVGIVN
jgi:hypothetical protein